MREISKRILREMPDGIPGETLHQNIGVSGVSRLLEKVTGTFQGNSEALEGISKGFRVVSEGVRSVSMSLRGVS